MVAAVTGGALEAFEGAVRDGDCERVRQVLSENPELEAEIDAPRFEVEQPAVVHAANRDDREMVDVLLGHGADINARSAFWGRTVGVLDDSPPGIRPFLLERGALPEITEFVEAVRSGDVERVRDLLARHASLGPLLDRPLFPFAAPAIVAAHESAPLVDLLLEHGADIDARSDWGPGGFGVLDGIGRDAAAHLIARGATVDVNAAASLGMHDCLRELVEAEPDLVRARGGDGHTPLHVAADPEIVDFLLDHGADIEATDFDHDSTPAQHQVNRPANCRRLIERGARVDLFMAAALGDLELTLAELERSPASIHARVHQTPYDEMRPTCPNIYNWKLGFRVSPHQVAQERGHGDVYQLLMDMSPLNERFLNACLCGDEELARRIAAAHPRLVHELADRDRCRFPDAVWRGNIGAARLMLELGFDVDERDDEGTALGCALLFGNSEMVELLLGHGPDLAYRNSYGSTPLGVCAWASVNFKAADGDYLACARLLVEASSVIEDWMVDRSTPEVREVLVTG